jgi:putative ABC transport system permease protein
MIWLNRLAEDARFAFRMLTRTPGFSAAIILTLAVGIGMTTAVFSVFNTVLLRPLAYPHPERLLTIAEQDANAPFPMDRVLGPNFVAWTAHAASFEHLVSYDLSDEAVAIDGAATRERVVRVSDGFWELSGARLAHGRFPSSAESSALVVSQRFFEERLGGDTQRLGTAAIVDGRPVTIVGVLPREFPLHLPWPSSPAFEPLDVGAYRSVRVDPPVPNSIQLLNVVGKLKPGVTMDQARAELETIRARVASANPGYPGNRMILRLVPLTERLTGHARLPLSVLMSAVVFVLLIACANIANLLLGRGSARQKEIAIRAAVGAGRGRLFRQLILESLMMAAAGGVAGLLFARWSLQLMLAAVPQAIPRLMESTIDGSVLAFTVAASFIAAVVFGIGPAVAVGGVNLQQALNLGPRSSSSASMTPRAGRLLVAAEMTLALVLLTGAGLLIKSSWRLNVHPAGFEPGRVLTMRVQFTGERYREESRRQAYIDEFLARTRAIAGVSAAGISTHGESRTSVIVDGAPLLPPQERIKRSSALVNAVSGGSAEALGLRLLRGRWIADTEPPESVVVNESVARRDFPARDALGHRVRLSGPDSPPLTIVGVVADLKYVKLDANPQPEVYVPYSWQVPWRFTALVRTSMSPVALAPAITKSVSEIDRTLPVFDAQSLEQALAESIAPRHLNLLLLAVFAAAALGLALIGIYGVIGYSVTQRTNEIGVRMALGADRQAIVIMVVRQALVTALAGIGVGIGAAMALSRVMTNMLYEVEPTDPQTFLLATVGLTVAALTASLVPAFRAARVDPIVALRE